MGGGMAGAVLAGALRRRGVEPVVLERGPASASVPGPIMLPYQAYDALEDLGLLDEVRAAGRPIAPQADGTPVAIAVGRQALIDLLRRDLPIRFETAVTGLLREAAGWSGSERTTEDIAADLVVGADGSGSPVRRWRASPPRCGRRRARASRSAARWSSRCRSRWPTSRTGARSAC